MVFLLLLSSSASDVPSSSMDHNLVQQRISKAAAHSDPIFLSAGQGLGCPTPRKKGGIHSFFKPFLVFILTLSVLLGFLLPARFLFFLCPRFILAFSFIDSIDLKSCAFSISVGLQSRGGGFPKLRREEVVQVKDRKDLSLSLQSTRLNKHMNT